MGAKWWVST